MTRVPVGTKAIKRILKPTFAAIENQIKYAELNALTSSGPNLARELENLRTIPSSIFAKTSSNSRLFAIKDNIATKEKPTTCASGILQEHQSPFEATIVAYLRGHGYIPVGKTNLDEFGMGSHSTNSFFGPVHNVQEEVSAGGSSGGSAVAVATGQCQMALGTDTGGSVRLPAAYNGVIGFKPSYGLPSRWGVIPYANSLDTVGVLSKTIDAPYRFLSASTHDSKDPTSIPISGRINTQHRFEKLKSQGLEGLKIGIPVEYNITELTLGVRQAWIDSLMTLQKLGCTLIPISLPNTKHALSAYYVLAASEASSNLAKYDGVRYGTRSKSTDGSGDVLFSTTRGEGFGDEVKRRILLGSYTLSSEAIDNYFIKAQKVRRLVQRDFDRVFTLSNPFCPPQQFDLGDMDSSIELDNKLGPSQVDFIVCPTAPSIAPTLESISNQTPVDTYMNDVFTVPSSLAGIPAISIPFRLREDHREPGKPDFAGIQIIGQYQDDHRLLKVAEIFESNRGEGAIVMERNIKSKVITPDAKNITQKRTKIVRQEGKLGEGGAKSKLTDRTPKLTKKLEKLEKQLEKEMVLLKNEEEQPRKETERKGVIRRINQGPAQLVIKKVPVFPEPTLIRRIAAPPDGERVIVSKDRIFVTDKAKIRIKEVLTDVFETRIRDNPGWPPKKEAGIRQFLSNLFKLPSEREDTEYTTSPEDKLLIVNILTRIYNNHAKTLPPASDGEATSTRKYLSFHRNRLRSEISRKAEAKDGEPHTEEEVASR